MIVYTDVNCWKLQSVTSVTNTENNTPVYASTQEPTGDDVTFSKTQKRKRKLKKIKQKKKVESSTDILSSSAQTADKDDGESDSDIKSVRKVSVMTTFYKDLINTCRLSKRGITCTSELELFILYMRDYYITSTPGC